MPRVSCKGLCGREFDERTALATGELLSTGVCRSCYNKYAMSPDECFGKGLADSSDDTCKHCVDFKMCISWKAEPEGNPMAKKKAVEEEELEETESEEEEEEFEEVEEEGGEEPEEEEESEEEEEEEEEPTKKTKKGSKPAPSVSPSKKTAGSTGKGGKTAPAPPPAKGKKTAPPPAKGANPAATKPAQTPFRSGSAKEKAFLLLKKGTTKEELEKALKGMTGDPWAFVQAKLLRRTTGGDKSMSWTIKEKEGHYRLIVQ